MQTTLTDLLWAIAIVVLGVSAVLLGVLAVAKYADRIAVHLNAL